MTGLTESLQLLAVLPENKQGKEGDEDPVLEVGIVGGTDPLQEKAGENRRVKPGISSSSASSLANGASRTTSDPPSWPSGGTTSTELLI
jgi:hypothetical protein